MRQLKIYAVFSILCFCAGLSLSSGVLADGDPSELSTNEANLLPDEQAPANEDAVATVTADGDFLLPTYLLPGETATVTRTTTTEKMVEEPASKVAVEVVQVPKTNQVIGTQKTVEVQQTTKPIVDTSSELEQLLKQTAPVGVDEEKPAVSGTVTQSKRLLIPLASVPAVPAPEPTVTVKERFFEPNMYATQVFDSVVSGSELPFKMPHEIRITFYPRASSFSGQTLKWIRAFATVALHDPRLIVEVRASCAEAELQNARMALVKGALQSAGLSKHQIRTVYTNRPVDTILLRAIPRPEKVDTILTQKDKPLPKSLSRVQKW